jgi:hypothetical protein
MSKKLRNLALLGGLGAAAFMAGRSKGEAETAARKPAEIEDATKRTKAAGRALLESTKEDKKPEKAPQKDEGVTASGLPREARGVRAPTRMEGPTASGMPREARGAPKDEGVTASGLPREARGMADDRSYRQKWVDKQNRAGASMGAARRAQMGFKKGGMVGSASKRADGIATKGKTRGRMV